jgi:hypothetical protein
VAVDYTPARYLHCHSEGHQVRTCKRPRSPDTTGPLPHLQPPTIVVLNPRVGDVALAKKVSRPGQRPPSSVSGATSGFGPSGSSPLEPLSWLYSEKVPIVPHTSLPTAVASAPGSVRRSAVVTEVRDMNHPAHGRHGCGGRTAR